MCFKYNTPNSKHIHNHFDLEDDHEPLECPTLPYFTEKPILTRQKSMALADALQATQKRMDGKERSGTRSLEQTCLLSLKGSTWHCMPRRLDHQEKYKRVTI